MGSDLFIIVAIGALIGLILFLFGKYVEMAKDYYKGKNQKPKEAAPAQKEMYRLQKPIAPYATQPWPLE